MQNCISSYKVLNTSKLTHFYSEQSGSRADAASKIERFVIIKGFHTIKGFHKFHKLSQSPPSRTLQQP